jgi:lipid A ethanolaminephosphotransferase
MARRTTSARRPTASPSCPSAAATRWPTARRTQLVNAYDNSIAYTDRFLNQRCRGCAPSRPGRFDTGLFYVSDHGESLGENGLYLHGVPYALAPEQQTHVPMVTWLSEGLQQRSGVRTDCLRERAERPVSHDHLFHSVLGLMDVTTAGAPGRAGPVRALRQPAGVAQPDVSAPPAG